MDRNTNAVGIVHDGTTVSVTESLTQIEIEIVQTDYTWSFLLLDFIRVNIPHHHIMPFL